MPDIASSRPVSGEPIATAWGTDVHDQLEGIQRGTVTVTWTASSLSNTPTVLFPRAYASPPEVILTGYLGPHYSAQLSAAPSTTGFQIHGRRGDGTSVTASGVFGWVAIGTLATPG